MVFWSNKKSYGQQHSVTDKSTSTVLTVGYSSSTSTVLTVGYNSSTSTVLTVGYNSSTSTRTYSRVQLKYQYTYLQSGTAHVQVQYLQSGTTQVQVHVRNATKSAFWFCNKMKIEPCVKSQQIGGMLNVNLEKNDRNMLNWELDSLGSSWI